MANSPLQGPFGYSSSPTFFLSSLIKSRDDGGGKKSSGAERPSPLPPSLLASIYITSQPRGERRGEEEGEEEPRQTGPRPESSESVCGQQCGDGGSAKKKILSSHSGVGCSCHLVASQECALQMWTLASLERDMMGDNKRWESGSPPCTYVRKQDYAYGTNETRDLAETIFVPVRAGAQCVFDGGTQTGCCSSCVLVYPPPPPTV